MESSLIFGRLRTSSTITSPSLLPSASGKRHFSSSFVKLPYHFRSTISLGQVAVSKVGAVTVASTSGVETIELANINWDGLGFGLVPTDYMYITKCSRDENFTKGELQRFGSIELSPSSGVLNYGQGLFEGLKAYRKDDGSILLFRPEENALRMRMGAERMCMPAPSVEQFVEAVKRTVLANKRWVPPPGKGSLYIRPLLMGSGAVLGLAPAPEYTFLVYVSPVGNYFKEGLSPINLVVENEFHRATPGGTGGVKTIGNYAAVLKAQTAAKAKGYSDVLYLDSVHNRYLEEVSSCNVFVVKDEVISTPAITGTILPGITRKSIIDVAHSQGYQGIIWKRRSRCSVSETLFSPNKSPDGSGRRQDGLDYAVRVTCSRSSLILVIDLELVRMSYSPCKYTF
ncbi:branched-chain-amino-acid aminotransferase 5, chloroplastic-like isoform X2 [Aristolochia californica]|uniref:branched-chain-amino-acid aminotransferase 5, chloroplastic-like isoform X2 n=1 Tax=Aristolochia californica TaxID=171875 RepID=UPI0035D98D1B